MEIVYILIFLISCVFLFMGLFMQNFANNSIFFGVRIPVGYDKNELLQKELKRFKKRWSIVWGIIFILSLFGIFTLKDKGYEFIVVFISIFSQIILLQVCYFITFNKVKKIKKQENWKELLTNKKVVYVDLNLQKQVEKSMNKGFYLIPWIIYLIFLAIPILKEKQIEIIIIISAVSSLIILQISILGILKTKQNLNGGDLESIKKEALSNKKIILKLLYSTQILLSILFGVTNLSIAGIISNNIASIITVVIVISTLILSLASALIISKRREFIRNLLEKDFNEKGQIILNKDDDDNYLMGIFYYNPNDPSLLVDKRMGVGMTFNFANPIAKIINVISVVILVVIFTLVIKLSTSTMNVNFSNSNVSISCMYSSDINYQDIVKIEYLNKIPPIGTKINGASTGNRNIGYYRTKDNRNVKLYIEDSKEPCVLIKLKGEKIIYFNYKDKEKTENFYKTLKNYYEKII